MKRLLSVASCLALATASWADIEWRTFENADKSKFFKGRLVGYDSARNKVTVQKQSTMKSMTFSLDLLSEDHQKFVKERSMELEAIAHASEDDSPEIERFNAIRQESGLKAALNWNAERFADNDAWFRSRKER